MPNDPYAALAELAGGFIHEIKNHLSTLGLNLQLLSEDFQDPQNLRERRALQRVQKLQTECQRLVGVSNDFLRFARIKDLKLEPTNLGKIVSEMIDFFTPTAESAHIDIKTFVPSDLPPVLLDRELFQQALLNLMLNADQAMPQGGEITLQAFVDDSWLCLNIIDTGKGIPPEVRDKIFQPFFSTKVGGSGLGLPTTRRIIEGHHGTIEVQSEIDKGTQFTIRLPVKCGEWGVGSGELRKDIQAALPSSDSPLPTPHSPLLTAYCTNVHAGADLDQVLANLQRFSVPVQKMACPDAPLGIDLWLSASAARKAVAERRVPELADWLKERNLLPFTLNGFPYGDFHRDVVKHDVYCPAWHESARSDYTRDLIAILHGILPAGMEGSISTLPIGWGRPVPDQAQLQTAAARLAELAQHLAELEKSTGRLIHIDLEPEPGCILQLSDDVVRFFKEYLLPGRDEAMIRRYLRVCHDVCHAAVMFEEQAAVLGLYESAGIGVGKIQVSSAVSLDLSGDPPERDAALGQLAGFNEPRYLHQTTIRRPDGSAVLYEDLPLALAGLEAKQRIGSWRVHFHVPIYVQRFGRLEATQQAIRDCLDFARVHNTTRHLEVETYAWGVLPGELQQPDLAKGIAEEMRWLWGLLAPSPPGTPGGEG